MLKTVLPGKNGAWDTNLILSSYRLDAMGCLIIGSVGNVEDVAMGINKAWANKSIMVSGKLLAQYMMGGSVRDISLPSSI